MNQLKVAKVDEQTGGLPDHEDGILSMNGIDQQDDRAADAEEPK